MFSKISCIFAVELKDKVIEKGDTLYVLLVFADE